MAQSDPVSARVLVRRLAGAALAQLAELVPGLKLEDHRVDEVPEQDLPFLSWSAPDEHGPNKQGQTDQVFAVTVQLRVMAKVRAIRALDCRDQLDALLDLARAVLLGDPGLLRAVNRVAEMGVATEISGKGNAYTGSGALVIEFELSDRYVVPGRDDLLKLAARVRPGGDAAAELPVTVTLPTS